MSCSDQPRLAAGLAGLGWSTCSTRMPVPASARAAERVAKAPNPSTNRGSSSPIERASATSHTASSGRRSAAGSRSGVRLRPPLSRKSSGQ